MSRQTARPRRATLGVLAILLLAVLLGVTSAFAEDPVAAPAAPDREPSVAADASPGSEASTPEAPTPEARTTDAPLTTGLAPMPDNARVPMKWLPPGAFDEDRGPSTAVFPPQKLPLRFNHKFHVGVQKLDCKSCHPGALTSQSVQDVLTPKGTTCDGCHGTEHGNLDAVRPGEQDSGKCNFCHLGYREGDGNRVARLQIPRPNMVFDHKKHAVRNIGCRQCHGDVEELELATRDQLPRMRGCLGCHQHPDAAARGEAKSACETCHVTGGANEGGRLKTVFASGTMQPPRWLHNAGHGPDFVQRHKLVAANDSQFCASCHKEESCAACHDGRVRPRNIHPNDYLSMHAVEARLMTQKCTSCHREQSFCLGCHQRTGVSMSGPSAVRESGRFHPPKAQWSDAPRGAGHHAFEAMRNLNACVSCHIERDCVVCHGGRGIGGGFNPHSGGFAASCGSQLRRNPRPCFVCHEPGAPVLQRCR